MTKDKALKLALEALEGVVKNCWRDIPSWRLDEIKERITVIKQALDKKAENARELGLDYEPAPVQEPVAHCEAGPEFCPVCRAETRSLALAAAVGYIQRNTPTLVWTEICNALTTTPPAAQRQWFRLSEEEIDEIFNNQPGYCLDHYLFAEDVISKYEEKNAVAQLVVPDVLNPKDENPAYAAGWNDCRAEMLRGKP